MTGDLALGALARGARFTEASLLRWLDHDLGLVAPVAGTAARLAGQEHAHDVAQARGAVGESRGAKESR